MRKSFFDESCKDSAAAERAAEDTAPKDKNVSGRTDNYRMTCEIWRRKIQQMDLDEMADRFGLVRDAQAVYIRYYHRDYRIDRESGMLTLLEKPEEIPSFNTAMSIYNLFYYAKPGAKVSGEFVPFRLVKRASQFEKAFQGMILKPLARTFSGRCEELRNACIALGGTPIRQGDVGYVIKAFDCIPVTIVFWDGDDEFEAQANILFDADITDFLHEETVVCIGSDLVHRLAEEAGIGKVKHLLEP